MQADIIVREARVISLRRTVLANCLECDQQLSDIDTPSISG